MPVQVESLPQLSVVEVNEKRLVIDIKPPKGKKKKSEDREEEEEEDDEYDPPSSAEIEVVHRHPPPDLHSILKQRTVSESSEDFNNADPDSPRSDGEELSSSFGKKRSVSFSKHVDKASFKSSASVSSMTPALKSKRRRQRKREEKLKGRTRHNSEGTSSGEDARASVSDTYSHSEEEESSEKPADGKRVLHRAVSDPGPSSGGLSTILDEEEEKTKGSGEPGKKGKKKSSKKVDEAKSIPQSDDVLDFRTRETENGVSANEVKCDSVLSDRAEEMQVEGKGKEEMKATEEVESGIKSVTDKNKKIVSEIRSKLAEGGGGGDAGLKTDGAEEDSDDDDFQDAVSSMAEEFSSKVGFDKSLINNGGNSNELEGSSKSQEKTVGQDRSQSTSTDGSKGSADSGGGGDGTKETSEVETMLSWEEGTVNGEDSTQCPFKFSNSVMFDLDVD